MAGRGRGAKVKGNANERALAKLFSDWWGWGEWARTPLSGGWGSRDAREGFRTCGDIITTADDFPFCLEAKKQEGWMLDQLIHNDACRVLDWVKQSRDETPANLVPLLLMARNNIPQAAVFDPTEIYRLAQSAQSSLVSFERESCFVWRRFPHFEMHFGDARGAFVIVSLSNFMKIDPGLLGRRAEMVNKNQPPEPGRPKPSDRPNVPEPTIPVCVTCRNPFTRCVCTDNNLKK